MVAHLDTVHKQTPSQIFYDSTKRVVWSPQGIGGDDRAGVYAILKIMEECKPHILFLEDEEIGGIGASFAATIMSRPDVNFMIELDRNGTDDAVFYECDNLDFIDYITGFDFIEDDGTFTDISVLSPMWDLAGVNLSIGYHHEHSTREYIDLNELDYTVERVLNILNDGNEKYFDFQEKQYMNYTRDYFDDDFDAEADYEEIFALVGEDED